MAILRTSGSRRPGIGVLLVLSFWSVPVAAQVQPNTPDAGLLINGMSGPIPVLPGVDLNCVVTGGPNKAVLLGVGQYATPGLPTLAGLWHLAPFDGLILDGLVDPLAATDPSGQFLKTYTIPWLAPLGHSFAVQGAVENLFAPMGMTLTAPSSFTVGAIAVLPQHLFFDPTTGAKGVDNRLPPGGTLPGDLPTLTADGFEGPTQVFLGELPVPSVFQNPFFCYSCHGGAPDIYPAYMGTMMANAARDPLFRGQFAIAVAGMEMAKQVGISWIGGELAADLCIRCHSTNGWQSGRSGFDGDGAQSPYRPGLFDEHYALDMEGVVCDSCHRATGFTPNRSPSAYAIPGQPDSGQLVIAPSLIKRGPFPGVTASSFAGGTTAYGAHVPPVVTTTQPPVPHNPPLQEGTAVSPAHDTEASSFLTSAAFCGTCHNVTNPTNGHAVERTYTEWLNSDYGRPSSPEFKTCQDCHLPASLNKRACTLGGVDPTYGEYNKLRSRIGRHQFVGGNAWMPQIFKILYPLVDLNWSAGLNYAQTAFYGPPDRSGYWDATTAAAQQQLRSAASVDLAADEVVPGTISAQVRITNLTGHKLPTGYPEGRRMWIRIAATDAQGVAFFQSGLLDPNSELIPDPALKVYEAHHALDYPSLGLFGPSFHFVLNNQPWKDNRILPKGGVQVKYIGGTDSYDPATAPWPEGGLYPDQQHWDVTAYSIPVPAGTPRPIRVTATVLYQTTSFAYVNFLANGGDSVVQTLPAPEAVTLRNLWLSGHAAPAVPVGTVGPNSTPDPTSPYLNQTALAIVN